MILPTYNFTNVIDDYLMKITHVMRGEEHISNTPKHILLQETFNFKIPAYAHLTLITDEKGKKLSKRNETILQFISQYKEKGFLPAAILNYLALLGWSPKNETEVFSKEKLIQIFDEKGFSNSSAYFDAKKMEWYNNYYIKQLDKISLTKFLDKFIGADIIKGTSVNKRAEIYTLYQEQIRYGSEIRELTSIFFAKSNVDFKPEIKTKKNKLLAQLWISEIQKIKVFDYTAIDQAFLNLKRNKDFSPKEIFMPTRIILTGKNHGPDLKKTIELFGQERTLNIFTKFISIV